VVQGLNFSVGERTVVDADIIKISAEMRAAVKPAHHKIQTRERVNNNAAGIVEYIGE
jgi:hypothetical protein